MIRISSCARVIYAPHSTLCRHQVGSSDDVPTVVTGLIAELSEFIDDVLPTANFDDEDNDGELKQATTPCPLPPRFPFPHSEQCPTFTFIFSSTPYRGNVS